MKSLRRALAMSIGLIAMVMFGIGCIWFAIGGLLAEFAAWMGK